MEEMTSDGPNIDPHSQVLPVQVGAQSDDLQVVACNIGIAFFLFVCLPSFLRLTIFVFVFGEGVLIESCLFLFLQWQSARWTNWRG